MQRIAFLCLLSVGFLFVRSTPADDKKPAPKSLAEEAQLLAKTNWISEEKFNMEGAKKDFPKCNLTISFVPDKGKPSGKATLGMYARVGEGGGGAGLGGYTFELFEDGGHRAMKLSLPDAKVNDKPMVHVPRILYYSLDGDKLTISQPPLPGWTVEGVKIQFKPEK